MSKCRNCKIEILDRTGVCPLCHCVVEQDGSEREAAYPDVGIREKRFALIIRIYVFLAVMAEALLVFINVNHHKGIWWSAITAGVFIYIYLIMKIGIQNDAGYRSKIILLTIFSIGLLFLIDEVAGYRGWSLNYVLPAGCLLYTSLLQKTSCFFFCFFFTLLLDTDRRIHNIFQHRIVWKPVSYTLLIF